MSDAEPRRWRRCREAGVALACLALAACAAPAVTLYTLGQPVQAVADRPLGLRPVVIAVARITIPDYLDSQDILVRRGSVLENRHSGRWASRLSVEATQSLTARLALRRPDALVTDQPQTVAPTFRILINISRLDVAVAAGPDDGRATLEADWLIVPNDPAVLTLRDRGFFSASGPVGTDQEVVALQTRMMNQLAGAIDISGVR